MSAENLLSALGPLAPLYEDPAITEIMIDSPTCVIVERHGKLEDIPIRFDPPETLLNLIGDILAQVGAEFAAGETVKDIRFPDNRARALIVLPPTAINGPYLVINKLIFGQVTWDLLFQYGSMTQEVYDLLQKAILARANILVAGGPASGKTTILNRLAELIPPEERVVIAEASHEFQISHPRAVYLEANATGMTMKDLLAAATKMRPDRLVISELRDSEAFHVLEVFNDGHTGGLTTIHAMSTEDALTRLETMCLMANLGLGLGEIRAAIGTALQMIVYQKRLPNGKRRITEIVELCGVQDEHYLLQPLMRYNAENDEMKLTGVKPTW
jgi:pilus assembly protein CpaF